MNSDTNSDSKHNDESIKQIENLNLNEAGAHALEFIKNASEDDYKRILDKLDEWKTVTIKIAIIGEMKAGKSSFINTIRGYSTVDSENINYSKVDFQECTRKPSLYKFDNNEQIELWDLPGVNGIKVLTKSEDLEKLTEKDMDHYFECIQHKDCIVEKGNKIEFDAFFLIFDKSLRANDMFLIRKFIELKKPFFVIYNKFDDYLVNKLVPSKKLFINNDKLRDYNKKIQVEMNKIKESFAQDIKNNINSKDFDFTKEKIYVISSLFTVDKINNGINKITDEGECLNDYREHFDFRRLELDLINQIPNDIKRETLIFSLKASLTSKEFMKKIFDSLRKRNHIIARYSGVCNCIPIAGAGLILDTILILQQLVFIILKIPLPTNPLVIEKIKQDMENLKFFNLAYKLHEIIDIKILEQFVDVDIKNLIQNSKVKDIYEIGNLIYEQFKSNPCVENLVNNATEFNSSFSDVLISKINFSFLL